MENKQNRDLTVITGNGGGNDGGGNQPVTQREFDIYRENVNNQFDRLNEKIDNLDKRLDKRLDKMDETKRWVIASIVLPIVLEMFRYFTK
ncbi:hypothetical protein [Aerococcus vaginalis]